MDNSSIHKTQEVLKYLNSIQIQVLFNSKYTPQLNIAEYTVQFIKENIRRQNTKNKYISIQLSNFPISKSLRTNLAHIIEDINCA